MKTFAEKPEFFWELLSSGKSKMIIAIVIAMSVGMCLPLGRGDIILVVGELVVSGGTKGQKLKEYHLAGQ